VKRATAFVLALAALIVSTATSIEPASAGHHHRAQKHQARVYHRHHVRIASTDDSPVVCRVGWWQGLRYGQALPYWGTRCR